jgi:hypothetical protein
MEVAEEAEHRTDAPGPPAPRQSRFALAGSPFALVRGSRAEPWIPRGALSRRGMT